MMIEDEDYYEGFTAKNSLRTKNKFTSDEDQRLKDLVHEYGENSWEEVAEQMPGRNVRQCKDRWTRYLSPSVNKSKWTNEEEKLLIKLVKDLNFKWVQISKHFKGRTDNQIKNKWNTLKKYVHIKKQSKGKRKQIKVQKIEEFPIEADEKQSEDECKDTDSVQDAKMIKFLSSIESCDLEDIFSQGDNQDLIQFFGY